MRTTLVLLLGLVSIFAQAPRRAPGFALIDSKGTFYDLYDFRGKPVLLEFMQTRCPHCVSFTDVLTKVKQKYGDKLSIIAVANPPDNTNTVNQFVAGHGIAYPVLFDMGQVAYSYVQKPTFDLPQVYLIDANGMIVNSFTYSPMTRDIFEGNGIFREIDKLMPVVQKPAVSKKK